ncbi:hypothetical protein HOL21_04890 [Candidatus Woesearchaeota archaeon]|jgi:hypothetical protein|nr:hypothetical protein [Candidatus Woesearchaeota archaeon]MBT5397523.1 hypothetical protein [Candidatus Woesearchaeota archaeon]MBT6367904.1 hypothetical protein [Candidatus Woesearchaeota archaeon]MBT7763128.1 hypothetical protein [Candidatus Woesearchaeota archaeon]
MDEQIGFRDDLCNVKYRFLGVQYNCTIVASACCNVDTGTIEGKLYVQALPKLTKRKSFHRMVGRTLLPRGDVGSFKKTTDSSSSLLLDDRHISLIRNMFNEGDDLVSIVGKRLSVFYDNIDKYVTNKILQKV